MCAQHKILARAHWAQRWLRTCKTANKLKIRADFYWHFLYGAETNRLTQHNIYHNKTGKELIAAHARILKQQCTTTKVPLASLSCGSTVSGLAIRLVFFATTRNSTSALQGRRGTWCCSTWSRCFGLDVDGARHGNRHRAGGRCRRGWACGGAWGKGRRCRCWLRGTAGTIDWLCLTGIRCSEQGRKQMQKYDYHGHCRWQYATWSTS